VPTVLDEADWAPLAREHAARVDVWVQPHLERRRSGEKHPVEDFLFDYYHLSPARLRRWHPGAGVVLSGPPARPYLELTDYCEVARGVTGDLGRLARHERRLRDVRRLLVATAARPASYGCFGLHEWAMVYRQPADQVRHGRPLRLGSSGTDTVVEAGPLRCTHIDAYRFFTPEAAPLNAMRPTRATQVDLEQPGCLHAGMDLYKWSAAFDPFVPSELTADCFAHAREIRAVDMRASPYDLAELGYPPIRVETPDGRAEYVRHQRLFAEHGAVLRTGLVAALDHLLALLPTDPRWIMRVGGSPNLHDHRRGCRALTSSNTQDPQSCMINWEVIMHFWGSWSALPWVLAGDLAGLEAGGAHVEALRGLADHRAHGLDVGVPAALGTPVRVRDAVTEARPLAADVAGGSHGQTTPLVQTWRSARMRRWAVDGGARRPGNRSSVTDLTAATPTESLDAARTVRRPARR
jgi:hypothetical protein